MSPRAQLVITVNCVVFRVCAVRISRQRQEPARLEKQSRIVIMNGANRHCKGRFVSVFASGGFRGGAALGAPPPSQSQPVYCSKVRSYITVLDETSRGKNPLCRTTTQ